ncbi:4Fe-4S binding protein [Geothermobacter hydrogeniphilus]|uniref:4Fe-4S ferredoxin-type domain-containing protein n=1 Tax=Geothermobacter hydrogeniphilus TaxID=1969733 RepID=A0A1X0YAZ4_9BACT|nr:4Fe-4S binding protein [Geothermobacter hydrogeniphilus]ORJ62371.1 hypothetical protein B5V00_03535 [Geothermobacter hydrogeniphilus]
MLSNLFDIPLLGALLKSRWTWRLLRLGALALLLAMIAWGWKEHGIPGIKAGDALMYTNLTNHLFWVWWIMGVVIVALFFGRSWCAVCPLGWLNGLVTRIGLKRELPGWLKSYIPVTLALVALQVVVYLFAIHRYPDLTARLLALLVALAVGCGLLFRQRAFCMLLCPAGAVFGLYARLAPFELRVKQNGGCAACSDQSCVSGGSEWRRFSLGRGVFFWHSRRDDCPVDLVPEQIHDSHDCTLCLNCVHNCRNDSIRVGFRRWMADLGQSPLPAGEALFLVVLLGLLTANFSKVYIDLREALLWPPQQAALLLGWGGDGFNLLAAFWVALLLPVLMLLPAWAAWRLADLQVAALPATAAPDAPTDPPRTEHGFWHRIGYLALPIIPLLLAVHLVLAVVKINAKAGYLPFALRDPSGVKSFLAINVMHTLPGPGILIPLDILKWIVLGLLAGGILVALSAARRCAGQLPTDTSRRGYLLGALLAIALPSAMYVATLIRWLFIR